MALRLPLRVKSWLKRVGLAHHHVRFIPNMLNCPVVRVDLTWKQGEAFEIYYRDNDVLDHSFWPGHQSGGGSKTSPLIINVAEIHSADFPTQGLVHGMTCRIYPDPWKCNPRPLWAALDSMGMLRPRLLGWWDPACPVSLLAPTVEYGHGGGRGPAAVASVFIGDGAAGAPPRFAVAVANWADHPVEVRIRANYSALAALGLRSERKLRLRAREIDGFQSEAHWALGDAIRLEEKGGGVDQGLLLSIL